MDERIKTIANTNSYAVRFDKAVEELIELLDAIKHDDIKKIIEEMSDVEVVLAQIKYLYDIEEEVELCKQYKIDRQLLRIEKAKAHKAATAASLSTEVGEEEWTRQLKL